MVRNGFTQQHVLQPEGAAFLGTAPYFTMPAPQLPAQRPANVPPVTAPARGVFGWRKAALPPQASPAWFADVGGLTYGPGGGPGQGVIQSAQPIGQVYTGQAAGLWEPHPYAR